jgi:ribosome-binding factor A
MGRRPERLAEGIREEVARIVASDLKDPRIGFVTITRVEVTHDLGHARVLVGVLGGDAERERSLAALKSAAGFVRREIGRRLRIRVVPEIEFRYDKGIDATDRVARLLREAAASSSSPGAPPAAVPGIGAGAGDDEDDEDDDAEDETR